MTGGANIRRNSWKLNQVRENKEGYIRSMKQSGKQHESLVLNVGLKANSKEITLYHNIDDLMMPERNGRVGNGSLDWTNSVKAWEFQTWNRMVGIDSHGDRSWAQVVPRSQSKGVDLG